MKSPVRNRFLSMTLLSAMTLAPIMNVLSSGVAFADDLTDVQSVADALTYIPTGQDKVGNPLTNDITLKTFDSATGSTINWKTSNPTYAFVTQKSTQSAVQITRPLAYLSADQDVVLTATVAKNGTSVTKDIPIKVKKSGFFSMTRFGGNGKENGKFITVNGATKDASNNIYIADTSSNRIQKFSSSGVFLAKWDTGAVAPSVMTIKGNFLYAVDANKAVIQDPTDSTKYITTVNVVKYDLQGGKQATFPVKLLTSVSTASDTLFAITVGGDGHIFVNDSKRYIQELDPSGNVVRVFGNELDPAYTPASSVITGATAIAVDDASHRLFITCYDNGASARNDYVVAYDLSASGVAWDQTLSDAMKQNGSAILNPGGSYPAKSLAIDAQGYLVVTQSTSTGAGVTQVKFYVSGAQLGAVKSSNTFGNYGATLTNDLFYTLAPGNVITQLSQDSVSDPISGDDIAAITDSEAAASDAANLNLDYQNYSYTDGNPTAPTGKVTQEYAAAVRHDVYLPTVGLNGSTITWSSDSSYVDANGKVTPPALAAGPQSVVLTASVKKGTAAPVTRQFNLTVAPLLTDAEAVLAAENTLPRAIEFKGDFPANTKYASGVYGMDNNIKMVYSSSDPSLTIDANGNVTAVSRPAFGSGDILNVPVTVKFIKSYTGNTTPIATYDYNVTIKRYPFSNAGTSWFAYDTTKGRALEAALNSASFNSGSLAFDQNNGYLYNIDFANKWLERFSTSVPSSDIDLTGNYAYWGKDGSQTATQKFGTNVSQSAVDKDGNVYVTDASSGASYVYKYSATGALLKKLGLGAGGPGIGQFNAPRGIGADSQGNLFVSDTTNKRIMKYDKNGTFIKLWTFTGEGAFSANTRLAVDHQDHVIVADAAGGRIYKFDNNGNPLLAFGNPKLPSGLIDTTYNAAPGSFDTSANPNAAGIAVDADDNIYVMDAGNSRVEKFDKNGKYLYQWTSPAGFTSSNGGIAVDAAGNVYVGDSKGIQVFQSPSSNSTLSSLTVSGVDLNEEVSGTQLLYTASVKHAVDTIKVTAIAVDSYARPTINGTTVGSYVNSTDVPLAVGANEIPVTITAQDGSQTIYMLTVYRAPDAPVSPALQLGTAGGTTTIAGVDATMEYSVNDGAYTKASGTSVANIAVNAGDTIHVRTAESGHMLASPSKDLTVGLANIAPAAAPTGITLQPGTDAATTKLSGLDSSVAYEYSLDGANYADIEPGSTFVDNLNVQVGNTVSVRVKETEFQPASNAATLTVVVKNLGSAAAPTAPEIAPGSSAGTVALTGVDATMEYSINNGSTYTAVPEEATSVDNIAVNAGAKILVRVKETEAAPASQAQELAVAITDITPAAAPAAATAYGSEPGTLKLVNVSSRMEYSLNGDEYAAITGAASGDIAVNIGDTLNVRVKETALQPASNIATIAVKAEMIKPVAAPTASIVAGSNAGTITLAQVDGSMQYSLDNGATFMPVAADATTVENIPVNANDVILVQKIPADTEHQPLPSIQTLTVGREQIARAAAPTTPTLSQGTNSGTTKLNDVDSTMEYSTDSGATYTAIKTNTLDNIKVNLKAKVLVRFQATDKQPASFALSLDVTDSNRKPVPASSTGSGPGTGSSPSDTGTAAEPKQNYDLTSKTQSDGTTMLEASISAAQAAAAIAKAQASGEKDVKIDLGATSDDASVKLPLEAANAFAGAGKNLTITTSNVEVIIPSSSLQSAAADVSFTIHPVNEEGKQQLAEHAGGQATLKLVAGNNAVNVIGEPVEISTNLQNTAVTLVLPLGNMNQDDAKDLGIYIEHSDGTKELLQGKLVVGQDGQLGLRFTTHKFSTFSIVQVEGMDSYFNAASEKAYVKGYPDGTFKPEAQITRAEVASILAQISTLPATGTAPAFSDVAKGYWAGDAIAAVAKMGLIKGYNDGTFHGSQHITRAEMASIIARLLGSQDGAAAGRFSDISGHWAKADIEQAAAAKIIRGYADGTFKPNQALTRAEAVAIINRFLGRTLKAPVTAPTWSDVPASYWAFKDIEAASHNQ